MTFFRCNVNNMIIIITFICIHTLGNKIFHDWKMAIFNRLTNWMTCINAATLPTMINAQKEIEVQVELYEGWDNMERAQQWLDNGITQVVYHQSRDAKFAGQTWGEHDLQEVKKLINMGFKVSVTGGVKPEVLKLFEGVDVYTFIAGRAITNADDPHAAAQSFRDEINRIWK